MISVLTPTRGRPEMFAAMVESAGKCEHCVYHDADDLSDYRFDAQKTRLIIGERKPLGICWNELAEIAKGDYLMMGNDDLLFRNENWQERLQDVISPEELGVACFDDGINGPSHFAFPIVTRAWYETLGYFTPEIFSYGYTDTWIFDVAKKAGVPYYIGDVLAEHLHPTTGKRPPDLTFMERNFKGDRQLFRETESIRQAHAEIIKSEIRRRNGTD